jgi:dihydroxy-acid dehydratase
MIGGCVRSPVRELLRRPLGSAQRALYKSMGHSDDDLERPIIGLANAYSTLVPGHANLGAVADAVRRGVERAGGTAVDFGVPGICDGLADHHLGAHYTLPSREIVAAAVEMMVRGHALDGVVLLGSCDKIVPGMLMAAARLDVPAIMVVGGPAEGGVEFQGHASDSSSPDDAVTLLQSGEMDEADFVALENGCQPGCGSCAYLGTANSMCCAAEAMGMSLPGSATIPATDAARLHVGVATGERIVRLVRAGVGARSIITTAAIGNAVRAMAAIGGSTNTVLHLMAIAREAGHAMTIDDFADLWSTTPQIARVNPSGPATVPDFHRAGGIPAVMREIRPLLDCAAQTVTGRPLDDDLEAAAPAAPGNDIIRPLSDPWLTGGGLAVLRGNLAPGSGITRPAAFPRDLHVFTGRALCFDAEQDANAAILGGGVGPGTVVVIRYVGPRGGPGMPEMYAPMKYLAARGLAASAAIVTDGRFSGTNNGCFVGHVCPEAALGGPIALVRDGDEITIDAPAGSLRLHVDDSELGRRRTAWRPRTSNDTPSGMLAMYARLAGPAARGALMELEEA